MQLIDQFNLHFTAENEQYLRSCIGQDLPDMQEMLKFIEQWVAEFSVGNLNDVVARSTIVETLTQTLQGFVDTHEQTRMRADFDFKVVCDGELNCIDTITNGCLIYRIDFVVGALRIPISMLRVIGAKK